MMWPGDYIIDSPTARSFFEMGPEQVVGNPFSAALGVMILSVIVVVALIIISILWN
jgi:hypothetical protein